jgi:predicted small lipoprotein YifL
MHSIEMTPRRRLRAVTCTALLCVLLALGSLSCGQRGPLYLPDSKPGASGSAATRSQADGQPQEQPGTGAATATPEQGEEDDEETP